MSLSLQPSTPHAPGHLRAVGTAAVGILTLGSGLGAAPAAHADVIILVTTAADVIANDGACSLREAITAANNNANYFGCFGTGGGYDLIEFSIGGGVPVISIGSDLPTITGPVEINGAPNRVELRGGGNGIGLQLGPGASGSVIRNLVVNGFGAGIYLAGPSDVRIAGNRIGTNADGTAAAANVTGIAFAGISAVIGGTSGLTPGGACTGDCNLISGNAAYGVSASSFGLSTVSILGNYIGTDAGGTAPIANGTGILVQDTISWIGAASPAGNLISGNSVGVMVRPLFANANQVSFILGNRIGTDATGTLPVPNYYGIFLDLENRDYLVRVGAAGNGNLVSGNLATGVRLVRSESVIIYGNRIGTQQDGVSPLPNGGPGVTLEGISRFNVIGSIGAGEGNVIAFNATGVSQEATSVNTFRGNSIHDNAGKGIDLASPLTAAPLLFGGHVVLGSACPFCTVDVYSDAADEGRVYEGSVVADDLGNWLFADPMTGPYVTATATSSDGTSEFSVPVPYDTEGDGVVDPVDNCTEVANPTQFDADGDGYGNICDADLNNSGLTTSADFSLLRSVLNATAGSSPLAAAADMNGSGLVTTADFTLLRARLNTAPGPSGLHPP